MDGNVPPATGKNRMEGVRFVLLQIHGYRALVKRRSADLPSFLHSPPQSAPPVARSIPQTHGKEK
jgi:hypothetical protein